MKEYLRYAALVISILLVIIVLVLGFKLIKSSLNKKDAPKQSTAITSTKEAGLLEAGQAGKPVQYTIRGVIKGNEEYHSIRFTIDGTVRRIEILEGYSDTVIKTQETENTSDAYNSFVAALNGAGFSRAVDAKGRGDEKQSCPLGRRYDYRIDPSASDGFHTWNTSCGKKYGTFSGNGTLVRRLFQLQIPNYDQFVRGTDLS